MAALYHEPHACEKAREHPGVTVQERRRPDLADESVAQDDEKSEPRIHRSSTRAKRKVVARIFSISIEESSFFILSEPKGILAQKHPRPASNGPGTYSLCSDAGGKRVVILAMSSACLSLKRMNISSLCRSGPASSSGIVVRDAIPAKAAPSIGEPIQARTGKSKYARALAAPRRVHSLMRISAMFFAMLPGGMMTKAKDEAVSDVPKPMKA